MKKILEFPFGNKQNRHEEMLSFDDDIESIFDEDDEDDNFCEFDEFMEEFADAAQGIRMLALDVDGVLTDGTIYIGNDGELFKGFNAKDGMGISYAMRNGIDVCIITGRKSEIVRRRAAELGITCVLEGVRDKAAALEKIADSYRLDLEEIAYVGDDLNDLAPMNICGLSFAPADAADAVIDMCDFVLINDGGKGAVREAVDLLLDAQGKLDSVIDSYINSGQGDRQ